MLVARSTGTIWAGELEEIGVEEGAKGLSLELMMVSREKYLDCYTMKIFYDSSSSLILRFTNKSQVELSSYYGVQPSAVVSLEDKHHHNS